MASGPGRDRRPQAGLGAAGYVWIFGALPTPEIKEHYDRRRAAGNRHAAAMRNLFNRLLGCLHHCLQTGQTFDIDKAFHYPSHASNPPLLDS